MATQNDINSIITTAINAVNTINCTPTGGGTSGCENTTSIITPYTQDSTKIMLNPLRGANLYRSRNSANHPVTASAYNRGQGGTAYSTHWVDLEPTQGTYDFTFVETTISEMLTHADNFAPNIDSALPINSGEDVRGRMKIGYRFLTNEGPGTAVVPAWVPTQAAGGACSGTVVNWGDPNAITYHKRLLEEFKNFIETFNGTLGVTPIDYIEWIDIGSVGYAGEWTLDGGCNPTGIGLPTVAQSKQIINDYINVFQGSGTPLYLIALTSGLRLVPGQSSQIELVDFALGGGTAGQKLVGWRQDCFGCPSFEGDVCTLRNLSTLFSTAWQRAPVIREVCDTWCTWPNASPCVTVLNKGTLQFGGVCGDIPWNTYTDLFTYLKDDLHGSLIQGLCAIADVTLQGEIHGHVSDLGSRLCITEVNSQTEINNNDPAPIQIRIQNFGSAPNYSLEDYTLELNIGGVTGTQSIPQINPGENKIVSVTVTGLNVGTNPVSARVLDRSGIEIELSNLDAIETTPFNYSLGNIVVVSCV